MASPNSLGRWVLLISEARILSISHKARKRESPDSQHEYGPQGQVLECYALLLPTM